MLIYLAEGFIIQEASEETLPPRRDLKLPNAAS